MYKGAAEVALTRKLPTRCRDALPLPRVSLAFVFESFHRTNYVLVFSAISVFAVGIDSGNFVALPLFVADIGNAVVLFLGS